MIVTRVRGLNLLHCLTQSLLVVGLFWIWAYVLFYVYRQSEFPYSNYIMYSLVMGGALLLDLGREKASRRHLLHLDFLRNHRLSVRQTLVVTGSLLLFLVAAKDVAVSRVFLFSFMPFLYVLFLGSNKGLPGFLARFVFQGHQERTLLVGRRAEARKLQPWLERKSSYGFKAIGLASDTEGDPADPDLPWLGPLSEVRGLVQEHAASQVILLDMPLSPSEIAELGAVCDREGVRLLIVNDLEDKLHRSISFMEDDGFHFISFRQEPLECPVGRMIKRLLDIALALPVVLFVLPITHLLVALIHWKQSPGPLFFRQKRNGRHHRVFSILKYRTMHVGHGEEALQATANDARIFRAGRWLRKLSVDELPQFINVLKGEMSVVGPRPHFVDHDVLFGEIANYYRVRSFIKPGITGLAQVRGLRGEARKDQDLVDRIHSDLYYLENWSVLLDWMIIFRTAWQMIFPPRTAY